MHCSRIFFDFGVIILLRLLLALFTCIIIGGVNHLLRWVGIQPASVKVHFVERLGGHRSHQAPCHSTPFATSSCWGKKDETFTQQLLQSALAIAALHLILELLTKVLSLSLSFFSVAAGRRAFSALFCSDLRLLSCCFILFNKSLCPFTMAVRRGMTVFKVLVLDMAS